MRDNGNIVLVGSMGAGKSAVGRVLASLLGRVFLDLDDRIEEVAGMRIAEIFAVDGEAGFRALESRALAVALARPGQVIATGGGAVLDAGSRAAMRAFGTVVYLQTDPQEQLRRVAGCTGRPLLDVDNRSQRLADLQAQREPLYMGVADLQFDTTHHTPADVATALAAMLATFQQAQSA